MQLINKLCLSQYVSMHVGASMCCLSACHSLLLNLGCDTIKYFIVIQQYTILFYSFDFIFNLEYLIMWDFFTIYFLIIDF